MTRPLTITERLVLAREEYRAGVRDGVAYTLLVLVIALALYAGLR